MYIYPSLLGDLNIVHGSQSYWLADLSPEIMDISEKPSELTGNLFSSTLKY